MSDSLILPAPPELFPTAQVPGAQTIAEVIDAWRARGLTPVQVTEEQLYQFIHIKHNALTGELSWDAARMDGLQAVSVLFRALVDMGEYFFKARARPTLTSGRARALLQLDGDEIQMLIEPAEDMTVVRGLLVACLLKLIAAHGEPLEVLAGLMQFKVGV